jgi:hypothetical protein
MCVYSADVTAINDVDFGVRTVSVALRASTVRVASYWKHWLGQGNEIKHPITCGFDASERIGAGG